MVLRSSLMVGICGGSSCVISMNLNRISQRYFCSLLSRDAPPAYTKAIIKNRSSDNIAVLSLSGSYCHYCFCDLLYLFRVMFARFLILSLGFCSLSTWLTKIGRAIRFYRVTGVSCLLLQCLIQRAVRSLISWAKETTLADYDLTCTCCRISTTVAAQEDNSVKSPLFRPAQSFAILVRLPRGLPAACSSVPGFEMCSSTPAYLRRALTGCSSIALSSDTISCDYIVYGNLPPSGTW